MENLNQENQELENQEENSLADDIAKLKESDELAPALEDDAVEETQEEAPQEEEQAIDPEEEERLKKAQEDYKKRQEERRRRMQDQKQQDEYKKQAEQAVQDSDKEAIEYFKKMREEHQYNQQIEAAGHELTNLEAEFREAYPDYDKKVDQAMRLTKMRLVDQGMGEAEAEAMLRREKILLADRAAATGGDPVEAVYNEANTILNVFEKFAEEMGYQKKKTKTNLQAIRETVKPNAMSGGAGKGATAMKKTFDDLAKEEVDGVSIGDMMKGVF